MFSAEHLRYARYYYDTIEPLLPPLRCRHDSYAVDAPRHARRRAARRC